MYSQGGGRKVTPPSSYSVGSPIPSSPSSSSSPHLRIHYLEQLCMTYKREKDEREEEFGRQRKVFMNHMTELDNEISLTKQTNLKLSEEVRDLSTQLLYKDEELKSIAAASKITEAQHREAFDADRVKYEEEIASLRQILDGKEEGHGGREREKEKGRVREREREKGRGREKGERKGEKETCLVFKILILLSLSGIVVSMS